MKLLVPFFFLGFAVAGQIGTGEWRIHSENRNAKDVISYGTSIFFAFDAALLEYDASYNEYSTWTVTNGLSDIKLTKLGSHESSESIFVGYENGNIDQIKNGRVINIPGIKLATILGSKRIHSFKSKGAYTYAATGFGIVKIDPVKNEIKDTYYPGGSSEEIIELTFKGDSIFALTPTRLYAGNLTNPALADSSQWVIDNRLPVLTGNQFRYGDIEYWNDSLYFQKNFDGWGGDSLLVIRQGGPHQVIELGTFGRLNSLQVVDNKLIMNGDGLMVSFNPDYSHSYFLQHYSPGVEISSNAFALFENKYWYADRQKGAVKRNMDGSFEYLPFEGPGRDMYYSMDWNDGILAVVPGAVNGHSEFYHPPGVMFFEEEKWKTIGRGESPLWAAGNTWDNISVSINPTKKEQVAVGGISKTPVSLVDRKSGVVTDTFSSVNSTLDRFGGGSIVVSSLSYDESGNLWITNGFSSTPLKMLSKDGNWYSFSLGGTASNKSTRKMYCDYNGNIWVSVFNSGMVGYNPGSSVTSAADDKTIVLNNGSYSGNLPSNIVTAITMDFDKELWIGTDNGFAILYNSENAFDAAPGSYNVQRPKIEINGEVDYILGSTYINDIEVDGGNRKWIATANSGMILLSDDGLSIIKHYTTENSPLISNNVVDLKIDHKTGEVFIITDRGLMSYRGDATYEDPEYSDVQIFPNPARPDHDGLITIQGIRYDSDVKITDVAGNVVYRTTSNGGTATWNGKTVSGEKVVSGVYLIWTASNINKGRFVGKVVVVN